MGGFSLKQLVGSTGTSSKSFNAMRAPVGRIHWPRGWCCPITRHTQGGAIQFYDGTKFARPPAAAATNRFGSAASRRRCLLLRLSVSVGRLTDSLSAASLLDSDGDGGAGAGELCDTRIVHPFEQEGFNVRSRRHMHTRCIQKHGSDPL